MQVTDIDLFTLPSLPISEKQKLPKCAGIYLILSSSNQVLYIGQSINIFKRWKQGHHRAHLLNVFKNGRIAWVEIKKCSELTSVENKLIKYFDPPFNGDSRRKPLKT